MNIKKTKIISNIYAHVPLLSLKRKVFSPLCDFIAEALKWSSHLYFNLHSRIRRLRSR